jgi:hypothetical protein
MEEKKEKSFSRKLAVTTAAVLGALILGVAFASWVATGTGSGTAKAATATVSAVTTDPSGAVADLYPGFTGGDLYFKITNPNPYAVSFNKYTLGAITMEDATGPCSTAAGNVSVPTTEQTLPGGSEITVPANTTTPVSRSIADVVSMSSGAANECQGDTFTITITLTGTQQ